MNVIDLRRPAALAAAVLVSAADVAAQSCGEPGAGDCCVANGSPACSDADCCNSICAADPFCCEVEWDDICARQAAELCNLPCTPSVCPLPCPPGALHEDEPCGADTNGGCNSVPPVYTLAACGLTFCGTAWADGGLRDTDWYLVNLPDPDGDCMESISATLVSQFPGSCVIADVGGGDCSILAQVGSLGCGDACGNVAVASATLPAPGTYAVFVATGLCDFSDIADGYPCGGGDNNYVLTIECAATCDIDAAIALLDLAIPVEDGIVAGFESAGGNLDTADVKLADSDGQLAMVETRLDTADGQLASAVTALEAADIDLASAETQIQSASTAIDAALTDADDAAASADQAAFHYDQVGQLALACGPCSDPGQVEIARILSKLLDIATQLATATQQELDAQTQSLEALVQSTQARSQAQRARDQSDTARQQEQQARTQTQAARGQQQEGRSQLNRAGIKNTQAIAQASCATTLSTGAKNQMLMIPPQIIRSLLKLNSARNLLARADAKGMASTAQGQRAVPLLQRADTKQERARMETARAEMEAARAQSQSDRSDMETQRAVTKLQRSEMKLARAETEKDRAAAKFIEVLNQTLSLFTILSGCGPCADAALTELDLAEDAVTAAAASLDLALLDVADAIAGVGAATVAASGASSSLQDASADLGAALPELGGAVAGLGDSMLNTEGAIIDGNAAISDLQGATGDIDVVDPMLLETIGILSACPGCPWDIDLDGLVGINDFLDLLAAWGPNPGHPADFDGDDVVGINDFLKLLAHWGACPLP